MNKLEKKIASWVEKSLISLEQKDKILEYEKELQQKQKSSKSLYTFIILGAGIIGIGFISIIAANWDQIPGMVKLIIDFALLASISCYLVYKRDRIKSLYFEGWLVFLAFFYLASIGLIAQVFHTGGELYQALFFWIAIMLPLLFISKKSILLYIWAGSFFMSALLWLASGDSIWQYWGNEQSMITFFVALPFFYFLIALALEKISQRFELKRALEFARPFYALSLFFAIGMIGMTDVLFSIGFAHYLPFKAFLPVYISILGGILLLIFSSQYGKKEKIVLMIFALITVCSYFPYLFLSPEHSHFVYDKNDLIGSCFTILTLFVLAIFFSIKEMQRLFNLVIVLIWLRFLIIYFQVMGSLLATGIGLILSGLIIVGLAVLWFRNRKKIENLFHRILK